MVENPPPPPPNPEIVELESRLALHSIYFPTAMPPIKNPNGGLVASQRQTLVALASDLKKYLQSKPYRHLILEGHADIRRTGEYNPALSDRRVSRTKRLLGKHALRSTNV